MTNEDLLKKIESLETALSDWKAVCRASTETSGKWNKKAKDLEQELVKAKELLVLAALYLDPQSEPLGIEKAIRAFVGACPMGGEHKYKIDGAHSNQYCGKCFKSNTGPSI